MRLKLSIVRVLAMVGCYLLFAGGTRAQSVLNSVRNMGKSGGTSGAKQDSLKHRTGLEDSITISFRYLDSTRVYKFDSTVNNIDKFYPVPADYLFLGNTGSAAKPMLFSPILKPGWDAGFHAYDVYKYTWENTKFYTTTRPFTELGYQFGSQSEQLINVLHTQNINQHWNFSLNYRMIAAPGFFKSQKTDHSNYRINTWYESPRKRYHLFAGVIVNSIRGGENGGILNDSFLHSTKYNDRFLIPTNLGGDVAYTSNIFTTQINTLNQYNETMFMLRQQYDLGQKDSVIVNDSTTYYLFYPRLRMQHTIKYNSFSYAFKDDNTDVTSDTTNFYQKNYNFINRPDAGFTLKDKWTQLENDFSLYQYPEAKNPNQFISAGATVQTMKGTFAEGTHNLYNLFLHGEYRNTTRNKKWDIELNGQLYMNGFNSGDYAVFASLSRYLGKNVGYLQLGFQNVNRTPSYIYETASSFNFGQSLTLNKENTTHLFATVTQPSTKIKVTGHYYLISNYTYFNGYYQKAQESAIFNLWQLILQKDFKLTRHWHWYADVTIQKTDGVAPVHVPLLYTRNRIAYEGTFYRKLALSTGLEIKYASSYKADGYSPLLGQFFYQNTETISNDRPSIAAYVHFRIHTFYLIARAENLNTLNVTPSFGFTHNNMMAPGYAYPGLLIRFGLLWGFVN